MMYGQKPHLVKPLALAIGLLTIGNAYAQNFSQVVIFGDSLSDMGRFRVLNPLFGNQNSFTTNPDPTWAGVLANSYGHKADAHTAANPMGTNYAVGNSRVNEKQISNSPPVSTQTKDYFARHANADPNALYAVWIGANDLLAANGKPPAEAANIITTAATIQASQVNLLHNKGANYILVPNIPNVGLTQRFTVDDPKHAPDATKAAQLYNTTLYRELNKTSANVIPANTFSLLKETIDNHQAFGFKVANGDYGCKKHWLSASLTSINCSKAEWKTPTANEDYIFADGIHPSGRTHRILAQYYRSLIEAPAQMAQLPNEILKESDNDRLHSKIQTLDKRPYSFWADVAVADGDPAMLVGLDIAKKSHHTGVYLSHKKHSHNLDTITADVKEMGVGVYHQHDIGRVQLTADVAVDKLSLDTDRQVAWEGMARSHQANADGRRLRAGLTAGVGFDVGRAVVRPLVGVNATQVKIDDIAENNPQLSTALQYDVPSVQSVQGVIGVDVKYPINERIDVYVSAMHKHEFGDGQDEVVRTKLSSMPEYDRAYEMPVSYAKHTNQQKVDIGAVINLNKATLNAGLIATNADEGSDVGGYVGVQVKF